MTIERATHADHAQIVGLLQNWGLPVRDLATASVEFVVARDARGLAGVAGLQAFHDACLLRSVAVRPDRRGGGVGHALVSAVEHHARRRGLRRLVLLTEHAEAFFERRGFRRLDRREAPADMQAGAEFRTLCPASAACMALDLE